MCLPKVTKNTLSQFDGNWCQNKIESISWNYYY